MQYIRSMFLNLTQAVTIFVALAFLSSGHADRSTKSFETLKCQYNLDLELKESLKGHLNALGYDEIESRLRVPAYLQSDVVELITRGSQTGDYSKFQSALRQNYSNHYYWIFRSLPFLSQVAPDMKWLLILLDPSNVEHALGELDTLIEFAPVWINSPNAAVIKKAYFDLILNYRLRDLFDTGHFSQIYNGLVWILQNSSSEDRQMVETRIIDWIRRLELAEAMPINSYIMLKISSLLPFEKLPVEFKNRLLNEWVDFAKNPPLRLSGIINRFSVSNIGSCEKMFAGHACTIGKINSKNGTEAKQFKLVLVQGQIIGYVKLQGDASMLSLANVFDESGKLVLAAGGVYSFSRDSILELTEGTGNFDETMNEPVDLKSVTVRPKTFLLNLDSFDDDNAKVFLDLFKEDLELEEKAKIRSIRNRFQEKDFPRKIWSLMLTKIQTAYARLSHN